MSSDVSDIFWVKIAWALGLGGSTIAIMAPWQEEIQWALAILASIGGLTLTILTIIYISLRLKYIHKSQKDLEVD